jgi:hypothetical protein
MTRDNQTKGKPAGNQNTARQKMDHSERAAESGRSGGSGTGKVSGETKTKISGGNKGGGGATRNSDR